MKGLGLNVWGLELGDLQSSRDKGAMVIGYVGISQNLGQLLGVPIIISITAFWDLYWGPRILGHYHVEPRTAQGSRAAGSPLGFGQAKPV